MVEGKKVAIIGVGLIGGSLGLAIKKVSGYKIVGIGRNQEKLKVAVKRGAIDAATTSFKEGLSQADIVFVATPVSTVVDVVRSACDHLKPGAIVTDVGSTKAHIVASVEEFLPPEVHFIGGHPMAGSEQQGVSAAHGDLFRNAFYILTPTARTNTDAFRKLHSLLTKIGAQVIAVDPDKHDKIVATISHLPHLASASLVNLAYEQTKEAENLLMFAAGSFRDMTRISAADANMWADICFENATAVLKELEDFQQQVQELIGLLLKRDRAGLVAKLREAQKVRASLPEALKKEAASLRELSIPVADRPGAISSITVAIGDLGINIESIEVIPVTEASGILKLVISGEENAKKAASALDRKGYKVSISVPFEK